MRFKNGDNEVMYGECLFCHQTMNITAMVDEDASESEMNRAATMHCGCEEAKQYRAAENAKHRAVEVIEEMIRDEDVKMSMQTLVAPVCDMQIKNVLIDDGQGTRYKMKLNKGGLIEVQVTVTNVTARS